MDFLVEATQEERAALAARMGLEAVLALSCQFSLRRMRLHGGEVAAVHAQAALRARVTQTCVVSLEPFEAEVAEDFTVRFVPEGSEREDVDIEDEDEIPYAGIAIDLGEAAAEQLALALDPFPRKPGIAFEGHEDEEEGGPFSVLKGHLLGSAGVWANSPSLALPGLKRDIQLGRSAADGRLANPVRSGRKQPQRVTARVVVRPPTRLRVCQQHAGHLRTGRAAAAAGGWARPVRRSSSAPPVLPLPPCPIGCSPGNTAQSPSMT